MKPLGYAVSTSSSVKSVGEYLKVWKDICVVVWLFKNTRKEEGSNTLCATSQTVTRRMLCRCSTPQAVVSWRSRVAQTTQHCGWELSYGSLIETGKPLGGGRCCCWNGSRCQWSSLSDVLMFIIYCVKQQWSRSGGQFRNCPSSGCAALALPYAALAAHSF